ncbi:MAG: ACGX-repeat peptide [Erysipelotrichaceae bacterium]|nr:ACGX-repeat peptide [Erysipelotrichaceae bacterium]
MPLSDLKAWNEKAAAACGTACGAADKPVEEVPAACGASDEAPAACGAADKPVEEAPAACGSACGASDK